VNVERKKRQRTGIGATGAAGGRGLEYSGALSRPG
jgi:hypothetical protein